MNHWIKRDWPRWAPLAMAIVSFVPCMIATAFLVGWLLEQAGWAGLRGTVPEKVVLAGFIGVSALVGYLGARGVYSLLRWRRLKVRFQRCPRCDYSLKGNVSGTCPECGWDLTQTPEVNHCWNCGYDLAGNESGVCPECGMSRTYEPPTDALCRAPLTQLRLLRAGVAVFVVGIVTSALPWLLVPWWGGTMGLGARGCRPPR